MLVGTVAIGVVLVLLISIGVLAYAPSILRPIWEDPDETANENLPSQPSDQEETNGGIEDPPKPAPPSSKGQDEQLKKLIEASNQNAGQPVVVVDDNPRPDRVVIRPDVAPRDQVERGALQAAINYYAAAGRGDYAATYRMLANVDKMHYSQAEWIRANRNLDSAAGRYVVHSTETVSSNRVHVNVTVYLADGSSFERQTSFIWEDREWRHDLTGEERTMFDNAL
jgi:hypothetical protein